MKKVRVLFAVYLAAAFFFFGAAALLLPPKAAEEAPPDVAAVLAAGGAEERLAVALTTEQLPVPLSGGEKGDRAFYFLTDTSGAVRLVQLSGRTAKAIIASLDAETGRLRAPYTLRGILRGIDDELRARAIGSSVRAFPRDPLTGANFAQRIGAWYVYEQAPGRYAAAVCTCLALCGLFFLVVALGHLLPGLLRARRGDFGSHSETGLTKALEQCLPSGETLKAGVWGVGQEMHLLYTFAGCMCDGARLLPAENGKTLRVEKSKYAAFDVYVGVSAHYLLLAECEKNRHYVQTQEVPDAPDAETLRAPVTIGELGACFPLAEITGVEVKNARAGGAVCTLRLRGGGLLRVLLPRDAGPGLPRQAEAREELLAALGAPRPE